MEKTNIRYYAKEVYGSTTLYPVDYAEELQRMTGKKTLTPAIFVSLQKMGFELVEVLQSSINK